MREIKFRAWGIDKQEYITWFEIGCEGCVTTQEPNCSPDYPNVILEQYTGLKDKNGKEIYDGDVLGGDWLECYIAWCNKCKQFQVFTVFGCMACSGDVHWFEIVEDDSKLEVIGNIHENPELIKEQE